MSQLSKGLKYLNTIILCLRLVPGNISNMSPFLHNWHFLHEYYHQASDTQMPRLLAEKTLNISFFLSNWPSSHINQVAIYTGGSQLEWRETGQFPTARYWLQAVVVDNIIYVTGGSDGNYLTSILFWDPSTESWQEAGDLKVARHTHAAVAIPSSILESECSAMLLKWFQ